VTFPETFKGRVVFRNERISVFRLCKIRPLVVVSVEETKEFERIILLAAFVFVLTAMKIAFAGVASKPD
jgi:hypothetical protein